MIIIVTIILLNTIDYFSSDLLVLLLQITHEFVFKHEYIFFRSRNIICLHAFNILPQIVTFLLQKIIYQQS